jgi:hypothetical protein
MIGRTFWFVAGAGAGLYTSIKARRLAYRLTPEGIADQLASLGLGARVFAEEVRVGMTEREAEIADRLALPTLAAEPTVAAELTVDAGQIEHAEQIEHAGDRAPRPALDAADSTPPRALAAIRS